MYVTAKTGFRRRRTDNFGPYRDASEQANAPDKASYFNLFSMHANSEYSDVPVSPSLLIRPLEFMPDKGIQSLAATCLRAKYIYLYIIRWITKFLYLRNNDRLDCMSSFYLQVALLNQFPPRPSQCHQRPLLVATRRSKASMLKLRLRPQLHQFRETFYM